MITLIDVALALAGAVLGQVSKNTNLANVVADVQAAIDKLISVRGQLVTFQQEESLRTQPKW